MYLYSVIPADNTNTKIPYPHPQLDCIFPYNNYAYSAGLDSQINKIDLEKEVNIVIGIHQNPVNKITFNKEDGIIYSSSWDKTISLWDDKKKDPLIMSIKLPELKVHNICINMNKLVICGNSTKVSNPEGEIQNLIQIHDLRKPTQCEKNYLSPLKYETRSICPINKGFILGSIEGKIAMEYFDEDSEVNLINKNYAFKCHREEFDNKTVIYPVNSIVSHPNYNIFLSAGGDKLVYAWDNNKRKKLYKSKKYPSSITSLDINSSGELVAIASSYIYEDMNFSSVNEERHKIFIKNFNEIII